MEDADRVIDAGGVTALMMLGDRPMLQVYGQYGPHGEVFFLGNRAGLVALHRAIGEALGRGKAATLVYVSDGEGYCPMIVECPADVLGRVERPYTAHWYRGKGGRVVPTVLSREEYQALVRAAVGAVGVYDGGR